MLALFYHLISILFFFFSSRRRHTRCYRDWSSDVCSSDLISKPCRRFSAHVPMRRVVDGDARAKIQNLQLRGLLLHLGESRRNSNQLATTTERVELERVAGFSAFHSTSYFFVRKNNLLNGR